jgi:hypothetical protein
MGGAGGIDLVGGLTATTANLLDGPGTWSERTERGGADRRGGLRHQ